MESSASLLWNFAVNLYAQPGIGSLCVDLQDNYAVNVNILLFARWLETRQLSLDVPAALNRIRAWDERYVQALRQLRRQMKAEFAGSLERVAEVRDHIKRAELQAEQQELIWLEELSHQWPNASGVATGENVQAYLSYLKLPDNIIAAAVASLTKAS